MKHNCKIDNIRAIAILSVVFGHSIILYSSSWNLYEPNISSVGLDYIKRFINLYQMPLFFSLSGYLLAQKGGNNSFFPFIRKKFIRLLIPFLAVGIFLMIPLKTALGYPAYNNTSFLSSIKMLIAGSESGHLWYLPTLFLIFIVTFWIIRYSCRKPYLLPFAFVAAIFLHYFRFSIPNLRIPYQYSALEHLWSFLLGSVIYTYKADDRLARWKIIITAATCLLCFIEIQFNRTDIFISAMVVQCIYIWTSDCENKLLQSISRNSFGIYLLHSPLIYITFTYLLNASPFITVGINLFVWGTLALFATESIRKTRLRFLVGG